MNKWSPCRENPVTPDVGSGGVEAIDRQILFLLSQRLNLTRDVGDGVWADEGSRKLAMTAIRRQAFELGIPIALITDFWDRLAEASATLRQQALLQQQATND